ncbi:OLC1v1026504C1 [Oldenlandia corymbosa var. corymbosa]|uniref:OLC1v1026504C1 n=1 Tax=Oldenlandia corymbosa var. corymbosa TaxID=529605 RepID=A0AAV1C786_OLDCO|nr:OLC1v1026504C1 [Oldenlandia corymbosa var. corymbosa]
MKVNVTTCFMIFILMHELWFACAAVPLTRNHNILLWGTSDGELNLNGAAGGKEGSVSRSSTSPPPSPRLNPSTHFKRVPPGPQPASSPSSPPSSSPDPCYRRHLGCIRPHNNIDDF